MTVAGMFIQTAAAQDSNDLNDLFETALPTVESPEENRLDDLPPEPARQSTDVVPDLLDALRREGTLRAEENQAATSANPQGGNPAELYAAQALAAVGAPALPALVEELRHAHWAVRSAAADILGSMGLQALPVVAALGQALEDESEWVRRNAAEALGNMGVHAVGAADALALALGDANELVRRNAALALAKIGPRAEAAVPALREVLGDENRYTRYNAAIALQRIGTPQANRALWEDLLVTRWCPITTAESPY